MSDKPLGRLIPKTWTHVERYALERYVVPTTAEQLLLMPDYWKFYDQLSEGACAGFAWSWAQSWANKKKYDAPWLYHECKKIDEAPEEQGTYLYTPGDVLRAQGHRRVYNGVHYPPSLAEGVLRYEWARSVDEVRAALAATQAVTIGVNWYTNFDRPVVKSGLNWIGQTKSLGQVRGGHAVCLTGVSDKKQGFRFRNSWGSAYPRNTWIPYSVLERLFSEYGEACVVVDRP